MIGVVACTGVSVAKTRHKYIAYGTPKSSAVISCKNGGSELTESSGDEIFTITRKKHGRHHRKTSDVTLIYKNAAEGTVSHITIQNHDISSALASACEDTTPSYRQEWINKAIELSGIYKNELAAK